MLNQFRGATTPLREDGGLVTWLISLVIYDVNISHWVGASEWGSVGHRFVTYLICKTHACGLVYFKAWFLIISRINVLVHLKVRILFILFFNSAEKLRFHRRKDVDKSTNMIKLLTTDNDWRFSNWNIMNSVYLNNTVVHHNSMIIKLSLNPGTSCTLLALHL